MTKLQEQVEKAYKELENIRDEFNEYWAKYSKRINESPCSVCNLSQFVLKYRDVNGKVEGRMFGAFSLFGGSISGYVSGETHTDPILSCRSCENERKIDISLHKTIDDIWNEQVPYLGDSIKSDTRKVSEWLQGYGLEVACELSKKVYSIKDYHRFYKWSDDVYPKYSLVEFSYLGLYAKYGAVGYVAPITKRFFAKYPLATFLFSILGGFALIMIIMFSLLN